MLNPEKQWVVEARPDHFAHFCWNRCFEKCPNRSGAQDIQEWSEVKEQEELSRSAYGKCVVLLFPILAELVKSTGHLRCPALIVVDFF